MNRRELREHTFKLVFHLEFHELEDMPIQLQYYFDDLTKIEEKDKKKKKTHEVQFVLPIYSNLCQKPSTVSYTSGTLSQF